MKTISILSLILVCVIIGNTSMMAKSKAYKIVVGTYTENTNSKGFYIIQINPDDKKFQISDIEENVENPGFLSFSKDKKYLYAASEYGNHSKINAYHFDVKNGNAEFLNSVSTQGVDPCYIDVSDKNAFIANYTSGDIQMLGIKEDGRISDVVETITFTGKSVHPERQTKPHAHQSILSNNFKYLFTNDLGADYLRVYRVLPNKILAVDSIRAIEGGGPRHLTYNKSGNMLYLLNELSAEISVISFKNEKLHLRQNISLISQNNGFAHAADIHISPDGKFLYATNRTNYNEIVAFKILRDQSLERIANYSVKGVFPRNFMITQDGRFVFVANQKTNQIVIFQRDRMTGKLYDSNYSVDIPSPVCLKEF